MNENLSIKRNTIDLRKKMVNGCEAIVILPGGALP